MSEMNGLEDIESLSLSQSCQGKTDVFTQVEDKDFQTAKTHEDGVGSELQELFQRYLSTATIHGIARIKEQNLYRYRRFVWILFVITMATALTLTLFNQLSRMSEHPVKTTVGNIQKDQIEFPAVTICNLNQYVRSRVPNNSLIHDLLYRMSQHARMSESDDFFTNIPDLTNVSDVSGEELQNISLNAYNRLDELLRRCIWRRRTYQCETLFDPIYTEYGLCFTFNNYKNTSALRLTSGTGPIAGLRVAIDIHQDEYFYSGMMQSGIKVLIHSPDQTPFPPTHGWFVRPGVSATLELSREDNIGLPYPYKAFVNGYCKDTATNPLKRHDLYTAENCRFESLVEFIVDACGCRFFSHEGNETICSAKETISCYVPSLNSLDYDDFNNVSCPPQCKTVLYKPVLSYADFAADFASRKVFESKLVPDKEYVNRNFIDLQIYFSTLNIVERKQEPELTLTSIAALLGGQMGLFLGASILSMTELSEVIILFLVQYAKVCSCRLFGRKKRIGNSSLSQNEQTINSQGSRTAVTTT